MKKKIKIAVNARFLLPNKLEGIGTYSHQVLKRLVFLMPEVEFHFLFDREWSEEFIYASNVIPHKLSPQARHPLLWYWWFQKSVAGWLKKNEVNLFLSTDSFMPLNSKTPTVLVMHDLAFEHFPEHVPFLVRKFYQHYFPKFANKAKQIFAVSKFTKQDIVSQYNIQADKISLAYCGVSEVYKPLSNEDQIIIRNEITNGSEYFISIGSLNPRKNTQKVIQAFNLLKEENKSSLNIKLLVVGAKGWKTSSLFEEINKSRFKKDIILMGHIEPQELAKYLASAKALLFPSLFEGFGIPIIEAYKCNVPVITANVSSTKEIGEGVSLLVNPNKIEEIKEAMAKILNGFNIVKEKEIVINEKLKQYNWNKTAVIVKEKIFTLING